MLSRSGENGYICLASDLRGKAFNTTEYDIAKGLSCVCVWCVCVCVKSLQCELCDAMDCSLRGSSVHGIFQARILEWIAVPSSRGSFWLRRQTCLFCLLHWQVGSLRRVLLRSPSFYYVLFFVYGLYFVEEFSLSTKYVPGFIMRYLMWSWLIFKALINIQSVFFLKSLFHSPWYYIVFVCFFLEHNYTFYFFFKFWPFTECIERTIFPTYIFMQLGNEVISI